MSNDALIAEFLAKGGRINVCKPGEKALNMTDREWRLQTQKVKSDYLDRGDALEREEQAERRAELAADFARAGDREAAFEALSGDFDR